MNEHFAKALAATSLALVIGVPVHAQTKERNQIYAPVGEYIRDVRRTIEFQGKDCSSYSAGAGIGCMTGAGENGVNVIRLGAQSPCRKNSTVQLDFTEAFYLVAVTCGSNKELIERFIKGMNAAYGPGDTDGSESEGYSRTSWKSGKTTIRASETVLGNDTLYKVMVHKPPSN